MLFNSHRPKKQKKPQTDQNPPVKVMEFKNLFQSLKGLNQSQNEPLVVRGNQFLLQLKTQPATVRSTALAIIPSEKIELTNQATNFSSPFIGDTKMTVTFSHPLTSDCIIAETR